MRSSVFSEFFVVSGRPQVKCALTKASWRVKSVLWFAWNSWSRSREESLYSLVGMRIPTKAEATWQTVNQMTYSPYKACKKRMLMREDSLQERGGPVAFWRCYLKVKSSHSFEKYVFTKLAGKFEFAWMEELSMKVELALHTFSSWYDDHSKRHIGTAPNLSVRVPNFPGNNLEKMHRTSCDPINFWVIYWSAIFSSESRKTHCRWFLSFSLKTPLRLKSRCTPATLKSNRVMTMEIYLGLLPSALLRFISSHISCWNVNLSEFAYTVFRLEQIIYSTFKMISYTA